MRKVDAEYHEAILPEYRGNPFIEALPPKLGAEDLLEKFSNYVDLDEHIRDNPDPLIREEYTIRLKQLRQPFFIYYECFRAIETAIKDGYSRKNPFSPTTSQFLHYPVDKPPEVAPSSGFFVPKAETITIIGESGVGKTCMLEQILNYLPHVIKHDVYHGQKLEYTKQVVWVKVECSRNSSVRELCEDIIFSLDLAMNQPKEPLAATISGLLWQIEQRIKSSFLGVLVIDEMQRLELKKTGGENNLLNFLHKLVNKLGVPLVFCANPPFDKTLSKQLKAARRAESAGYFEFEPLTRESGEWDVFIGELWEIQWTKVYNELTPELSDKMYKLSLGNLDIAHRIYREAQRMVILDPLADERITPAVLDIAYARACKLSRNTPEIQTLRESVSLPTGNRNQNSPKELELSAPTRTPIADVTRPQHPEFESSIVELLGAVDLPDRIANPCLFQDIAEQDEGFSLLKGTNTVLDDPLGELK
ncbi:MULTISPECIES: ATP-binding protein [Pseudoalteromonas]|uniref:ATP-binding protein n=1 Tax=Pseudoalteromonas maricaloris TaxID=184924 RepID=A0A8I2H7R3_9GAMM|nr:MULTISPECIES: ATP-binding protein [Pseudoalteromonas]NLR21721.1 ATP-binding protein [Pseudoalteromonas maricaloris]ODB37283.1 transposase [Pseudoalteromonas sp. BMB]WOX28262.1 ATP-binding protein [Pseudoalteromonas maricaloris]